ncbi:1-deoxy-D-xylulose-5-phosphate synthase 1 [Vulcanimicrobium alpinum]|uniref:1-deoxy-D-xylulose-5-phosphate synthase n=1 Tax=Vulcanimicrobium alpinum TaxID=3016050 RepID=A0AAN1XUU5_UNVUL|nr:1-deoxy-D-xylulose-5-phosphate synthase [Vulcanimicrobium alpinum]BDE05867.1 1-deoxy-D-xylulose-5-phosphate synthase 1 [Vulcanimicrobium alpinum]
MILERIASPADVKRLPRPELDQLAREIRETLIRVCAANGGHLAPNLGVVELTLALHRVLELPRDVVVWDVSHQSYVHKLLTGRAGRFETLRQAGGISGFAMRTESEYDQFGAGHASTAISAALGMATARDLKGGSETVVAVIGDGAMTGGLAYEAINNAGLLKSNFIVILNDNEMSIAPNVGSIASYLGVLRSKPFFTWGREVTKGVLDHVPLGGTARKALSTAELAAMRFVSPEHKAPVIFEEMGFRYIGPVDGHDLDTLIDVISNARKIGGPVLLHVKTVKGKGYDIAEGDSRTFHGVGPGVYHPDEGKLEKKAARITFAQAFADALIAAAQRDPRVIGITAAMPDGTGLAKFAKAFPSRYFDVGIAEAHAVCFGAGASTRGIRPVAAIYSTFLQRAYDQIVHDVAIQQLPVVFAMDRAGFVGDDGPTHMGLYDVAYLRTLPGITIMAPRNEYEVGPMLDLALTLDGPAAIRYPRGSTSGKHDEPLAPLVLGRAEVLREGSDVAILALGNTVDVALDAYELLDADGVRPTVVNARFVAPLDETLLIELAETHHRFITLEEHSLAGGFGSAVVEFLSDRGIVAAVERIGVPNVLVQHASQAAQRAQVGLSAENVAARVRTLTPSQTA